MIQPNGQADHAPGCWLGIVSALQRLGGPGYLWLGRGMSDNAPGFDVGAMIKAAVDRQKRREAYRASKRADAAFFKSLRNGEEPKV